MRPRTVAETIVASAGSLHLTLQSADVDDDSTDSPCNQTYSVTQDKSPIPHGSNSRARKAKTTIVKGGPGRTTREVQLETHPFANQFWVSASGRYVAFLEGRLTTAYQSEMHAWVKDLETGKETDVVGIPPPKYGSPDPQVTLSVLCIVDGGG